MNNDEQNCEFITSYQCIPITYVHKLLKIILFIDNISYMFITTQINFLYSHLY